MASTPMDPSVQLGKNSKKRVLGNVSSENPAVPRKKPKLNRPTFFAPSELVTFRIGNEVENEPFAVHKEFACYYSPVLNAAFKGPFIEGQTQTYNLEDIDTTAFRMLVHWLYTQKLDLTLEELENPPALDDTVTPTNQPSPKYLAAEENQIRESVSAHELHLVQLWVIADRLLIPALQNAAIETLVRLGFWGVDDESIHGFGWIDYAYEHTQPQSPLRRLAVDAFVYVTDSHAWLTFKDNAHLLPKEFLIDLAIALNENIHVREMPGFQRTRFPPTSRCYYVPMSN